MAEDQDEIEQLIMTHPQDNLNWRFKLHLPWKIVKANAAPSNIDYRSKTVEWNYQTTYLWNHSQVMLVKMKKGFPWLLTILIILGLFVILVSLLWWRRHHIKHAAITPQA